MKNQLFYGDCLDVLKNSIEDESIDLIYIDPPFNSKRNYNVLFESIDMTDTKAQKEAFADTWSNVHYMDELSMVQDLNLDLWKFLNTLNQTSIPKSSVSYLTTMALRILYMFKKLKTTGSFYLHCDPTMSHGLKLVCDFIFGTENFRNEIVWFYRRWTAGSTRFQRMHDVILFYSKSKSFIINQTYVLPTEGQLKKHKRGWDRNTVPVSGERKPQLIVYDWEKVNIAVKEGRLNLSEFARIVEPHSLMTTAPDVWHIDYLNSQAKERLGYPTQKPEALLERIIQASSKEGDIIADFFCGCGTAVAVANRLNRRWIGVDISHLAVRLIYNRVLQPYRDTPDNFREMLNSIDMNGFPRDIATAHELAEGTKKGRFKFQDWVIEFMMDGVSQPKKVADGGYDGYLTLYRDAKVKDVVLIEVKSGSLTVKNIREFIHVIEHEKAAIGVFVCFGEEVTKPMQIEALQAGYYDHEAFGTKYPKIQILTIEELLEGKSVQHPNPSMFNITFKRAQ